MNSEDKRTVIGGVDRNDGTFAAPAQETKCARIGNGSAHWEVER